MNKKEIQKLLNKVSLLDFCNLHSLKWNVDCYYATKALVGGFTPSQVFGDKKDDLQYKTWKEVLETRDSVLIVNYFRGVVRHEFHFQGYTDVLRKCRSLFEQCMPEGELKTEVIDLYMKHDRLEAGKEAPAFTMLDGEKRNTRWQSLKDCDYRCVGDVVWRLYQELPYFIKVKEKYKDRKDVEFITVSIDDVGSFDKWKKFLEERGYTSGINLITFARKNPFCDDYGIMGVPKYFIIGKDGKFLSRDVPGPGDGFEEMVEAVLSK
ncbi:MAG: TlpA family protein disulfide reductase [Butyricimonas faecalis]